MLPGDIGRRRHHRAGWALQQRCCGRWSGSGLPISTARTRIPIYVLNVVYPLVPEEIARVLRRQARRAGRGGGPPRLHRAGDRRRSCAAPTCNTQLSTARTCCRWAASIRRSAAQQGLVAFLREMRPQALDARRHRGARRAHARTSRPTAAARVGALPRAPADLLHRLPGAPGVFGDQAAAARDRPDACRGRHRLPCVCDLRAVQPWAIRFSAMACRSRRAAAVGPNLDRRPIA